MKQPRENYERSARKMILLEILGAVTKRTTQPKRERTEHHQNSDNTFEGLLFHLVKMDKEKIDIGVIQRFRSGVSVDKKSKKKVLAIFKYLTGKESPVEAVELTVRRDQNLREAQLKVMYEMVKLVEGPPTLVRKDCCFLSMFYYFSFFFENSVRFYAKISPGRTKLGLLN